VLERLAQNFIIIIMIIYLEMLMTNQEVKNREAENGQKVIQKQLSSSFHISKNRPRFFGNQKLSGFKKCPKNVQKTDSKKPPKNRNVNPPIDHFNPLPSGHRIPLSAHHSLTAIPFGNPRFFPTRDMSDQS
jgi:hypothetical protein